MDMPSPSDFAAKLKNIATGNSIVFSGIVTGKRPRTIGRFLLGASIPVLAAVMYVAWKNERAVKRNLRAILSFR